MILEEKLVLLRKEKKLSQSELAEMMGVSRQAVSRWETGASVPSSENLKYLRDFYGVSMDYLFNDSADIPEEQGAPAPASETETETEHTDSEKTKHKSRPITAKSLLRNAQILLIGLIFLTVTYYISKMCLSFGMRIYFEKGVGLLAEILTVTASLLAGLLLAPAAAALLRRSEYKRYMLYITAVLAVSLLITWKLMHASEWIMEHWKLDPQFLPLSFTIPSVLSHFAALLFFQHKHLKSKEKASPQQKKSKNRLAEFRRSPSEPSK